MRACVRRTTACWLWWALPTFASGNDERIAGAQSHIHDGRATDGLLQIVEFLPAILDTAHEKRVADQWQPFGRRGQGLGKSSPGPQD
jgi:hypothetical protein